MKRVLLLFLLLFFSYYSYCQCTWAGVTTDWNTASNWSSLVITSPCFGGGSVPSITDDVTIPNTGINPTIDGENATAANVTIQTLASLNMTGGSLTLPNAGVLTINLTGSFSMSGGDLYINKDVGAIDDANIGVAGGFVASGGTVHFIANSGAQEIDANVTYPDIQVDGGALVTTSINLVLDDLTVTNNSTLSLSNTITNVADMINLTVDAGSELILTGAATLPQHTNLLLSAGKVTVNGTNKSLVGVERDFTIGDLEVDLNAGQQLDLDNSCDVIISNDLTITQGILDVNSGATLAGIANTSTMSITATGELALGGTHPFPTLFDVPTINSASTVAFYGTNQNVGAASGEITFGNLIINGTDTKTLVNDIAVAGDLDILTSVFDNAFNTTQDFQITGGSGAISLEDDCQLIIGKGDMPVFTGGYDFTGTSMNNSIVVFNDENADQVISNAAHVFDNLTINGSEIKTIAHGISITNGGTLTVDRTGASAVTLDANANSIGGDFILNVDAGDKFESGAVTPFTGTITETLDELSTFTYNGDAQNIPAFDYGKMELSDDDGTESEKVLVDDTPIDNSLTINDNVRLRTLGFSINGDGSTSFTLVGNAIFEIDGTDGDTWPTGYSLEVITINSTVDYGSTIAQVIADKTYGNLTLSGGAVNKTIANSTEPEVRNTLDIEDGVTLPTVGPVSGGTQMIRLLSTGDAANQTAKIADLSNDGGGTITGTGVICERDMDLAGPDYVGWNDWAAPIENFRLANWYYGGWPMTGIQGIRGSDYPSNPFCSVLTYDAQISTPYYTFTDDEVVDKNDGWVRGPSITSMNNPGVGFRLYTGARDINLEDIGLPTQGTQVINLYYEDASAADSEEGWNLVGNPYMCTVDFDLITKTASVEPSMWMYSNVYSGYYAYNALATTGNAPFNVLDATTISNGYIPSHKAFWVKANAASQSLTFEESHKVTEGTAFIKNANALPKIRMQAQNLNNGLLSAGVIIQMDGAKGGLDKYDTKIFKSLKSTAPNLSLMSKENIELSINAIDVNHEIVPVQIESGVSGDFELRFWDFNEIHTGSCIWLEDKFTEEWFDLREEQSIIRTLSDTTTIARFNVHIKQMLDAELFANTTCFGTNDGEVLVKNLSENVIGLALYDESGIVVYQDMVTNNKVWKDLLPGKYTVREMNTNIGCPSAYATVEVFEPEEIKVSFEKSKTEIDLATEDRSVEFISKSTGGTDYVWFFSDNNQFAFGEEVTHIYEIPGLHDVSLLVHNGNYDCAMAYEDQVLVKSTVSVEEQVLAETVVNATVVDGQAKLNMNFETPENVTVLLFDMAGKELGQWNFEQVSNNTEFIDLPTTKSIYLLKVKAANKKRTFKLF